MTPPVCCTTCGIDQLPDSTFCHGCGQPLSGGRALPAADGEHKRITVLFIDAFGSIGLDNRLDAEQWHEIMESFFSVISTAVQHYGGTIDRLTGEGIKILFGAPAALERHATHACHAALHIRDCLGEFAETFRTQVDLDLAARMGINSGEVVFGRVGATGNVSFTSQGHTAALAAHGLAPKQEWGKRGEGFSQQGGFSIIECSHLQPQALSGGTARFSAPGIPRTPRAVAC